MRSNIEAKKPTSNTRQWRWFIGLYAISLVTYGAIELGLHYLNVILVRL